MSELNHALLPLQIEQFVFISIKYKSDINICYEQHFFKFYFNSKNDSIYIKS